MPITNTRKNLISRSSAHTSDNYLRADQYLTHITTVNGHTQPTIFNENHQSQMTSKKLSMSSTVPLMPQILTQNLPSLHQQTARPTSTAPAQTAMTQPPPQPAAGNDDNHCPYIKMKPSLKDDMATHKYRQ